MRETCVPCASPTGEQRNFVCRPCGFHLSVVFWLPFGQRYRRALVLTFRHVARFLLCGAGEDELVLHGVESVHGGALRQPPEDDVRVPLLLRHLPPGVLRGRHGDVHDLLGEPRRGLFVLPEYSENN